MATNAMFVDGEKLQEIISAHKGINGWYDDHDHNSALYKKPARQGLGVK